MRTKLRDYEIRATLAERLKKQFPAESGSIVVDEFGCHDSRIDVAVINCKLHGYEIKSECDSLDRLVTQAPTYSAIFDRMTVVVTAKHVESVQQAVPLWWGILEAALVGGGVRLRQVRRCKANSGQNPAILTKMLWRKELYAVLRSHGLEHGLRLASAEALAGVVAENLPVRVIADEVREAIKVRGGSGFDRQRTRNGGSCTTESTAEHYQSNLEWLLSGEFHRPQH